MRSFYLLDLNLLRIYSAFTFRDSANGTHKTLIVNFQRSLFFV